MNGEARINFYKKKNFNFRNRRAEPAAHVVGRLGLGVERLVLPGAAPLVEEDDRLDARRAHRLLGRREELREREAE